MGTFTDKTKFYNKNIFRFTFLLLLVGISSVLYKWEDISTYYKEKRSKEEYENLISRLHNTETKKFKELKLTELKIPRIVLETKFKHNKMYYKLFIISEKNNESSYVTLLPDSLKNDPYFETKVKTIQKIEIEFMDKDGFKIYNFPIEISDMARNIDEKGNVFAYSINSNIDMDPYLYENFHDWEFTYTKKR
ncbi:MAG: hypothetical protein H3C45_01660 [Bacteroidia bacterium]|nr:hypothetical protein [Bacteroidia bacterium]